MDSVREARLEQGPWTGMILTLLHAQQNEGGMMTLMRYRLSVSFVCVLFLFGGIQAEEPDTDEAPLPSIDWTVGPDTADLGELAQVEIPQGFVYTGKEGTNKMMELMENPIDGSELGFLAPENMEWFVVFEYAPVGYVKDDEKEDLDGDAILESIQEGNRQANRIRRQRGWSTVDVVGWSVQPNYNPETHNLEWAILGESDGHQVINHSTRLLGRRGVMSANLVLGPEDFETVLPSYTDLLSGYRFRVDSAYSAYRPGDKIAEYGLTALITGGAVVASAKAGVFKKLWKFIVIGIAALVGFLRKLFGGSRTTVQNPT